MKVKYSVEFNTVIYKKYKQGAPKHLLAKGGRWKKAGEYVGFENMAYEPSIITENRCVYECAPELLAMLEKKIDLIRLGITSDYSGSPDDNELYTEVSNLIAKAKGE